MTRFLYAVATVVAAVAFFVTLGPAPAQIGPPQGPIPSDVCGCKLPTQVTMTFTDMGNCACINNRQVTLKQSCITQGGQTTWQGVLPTNAGAALVSFYCGKMTGHPGYVAVVEFGGQIAVAQLTGTCTPLLLAGNATNTGGYSTSALCLNNNATIKITITP